MLLRRKELGKRKDIRDKSNDRDDEFKTNQKVDVIEEVNDVMNDVIDFLSDDDGETRSRFLEFNEENKMQDLNIVVRMKFESGNKPRGG